jgi:hypothetical protein
VRANTSSSTCKFITAPALHPEANTKSGIQGGDKRRSQSNFKHEIFPAYSDKDPEPRDIVIMQGRAEEHTGTLPKQWAVFYSRYRCWQKLVVDRIEATTCEDDALAKDSATINTSDFPKDGITLLGGAVRTPGAWSREMPEFVKHLKFLEVVKSFMKPHSG